MNISYSNILPHTLIYHQTEQEKRFADNCLAKIGSKEFGGKLLYELQQKLNPEQEIKIKVVNSEKTSSKPYLHASLLEKYRMRDWPDSATYKKLLYSRACYNKNDHLKHSSKVTNGAGASTEILFNPNESRITDEYGVGERKVNHEYSFLSLAHELILALYTARGERFSEEGLDDYSDPNEARAIGLLDYQNYDITENRIRHEQKVNLRSTWYDRNDVQHLVEKYFTEI